jgi:hypothetical protein
VSAIAKIRGSDESRTKVFSDSCASCQGDGLDSKIDVVENKKSMVSREDAPTTPVQGDHPQLEDKSGPEGQWTSVINRKKSKFRFG